MTVGGVVVIVLLVLNLIVACVYLVWNKLYGKQKNYIVGFVVMLLCPVIGACFYLLAYLVFKFFMDEPVDLEDVVFNKTKKKAISAAEEEKESNVVSMEEAIAITNKHDLRALMMNVVRGDIKKYLHSISLALDSEDTETAHYAASVMQEALNDFRVVVEKEVELIQEDNPNVEQYCDNLLSYMNDFLEQRAFTDMEQQNYVKIMDEVGDRYFAVAPGNMVGACFEALAMRNLEVKDYDRCEKWCERLNHFYPDSLSSFSCRLKLYFTCENKARFFEVIDELKESNVVLDNETLELIRVFN